MPYELTEKATEETICPLTGAPIAEVVRVRRLVTTVHGSSETTKLPCVASAESGVVLAAVRLRSASSMSKSDTTVCLHAWTAWVPIVVYPWSQDPTSTTKAARWCVRCERVEKQ